METIFRECSECDAKPGSPVLCQDCLDRRSEFSRTGRCRPPRGGRKNLAYPKDREALADQFILVLNELVAADRHAVQSVFEHRVFCNGVLAGHPTVQVVASEGPVFNLCVDPPKMEYEERPSLVGALGILNGLVGVIESGPKEGWGLIAAEFDGSGRLLGFVRTPQA